jgi:hypothetical protein
MEMVTYWRILSEVHLQKVDNGGEGKNTGSVHLESKGNTIM